MNIFAFSTLAVTSAFAWEIDHSTVVFNQLGFSNTEDSEELPALMRRRMPASECSSKKRRLFCLLKGCDWDAEERVCKPQEPEQTPEPETPEPATSEPTGRPTEMPTTEPTKSPTKSCEMKNKKNSCLDMPGCEWDTELKVCYTPIPETSPEASASANEADLASLFGELKAALEGGNFAQRFEKEGMTVSTIFSVISAVLPIVMKIVKYFMGSMEAGKLTTEQIQEIIKMIIDIIRNLMGSMEVGRLTSDQIQEIIKMIIEIIKSIIGGQ
jgi:hypothetical protein